jgi:hypothetical protein
MIVKRGGAGLPTNRRSELEEGLKTRFEGCWLFDAYHTDSLEEVRNSYPQRSGTRPGRRPVG